jgi:hypothetical protein
MEPPVRDLLDLLNDSCSSPLFFFFWQFDDE